MSEGKRRRGDRRDGRWVREVPGLQCIMANLMPNRTDCEVHLNDSIDVTELMGFIERKNLSHPEYKTTVFHCFMFSFAKMIRERPILNRFIQGRRMYERNEISLSFVCKRRFSDHAEEALMVLVPKDDQNIDSFSENISGEVKETRKSEHATGGVDALLDRVSKLPRLLVMLLSRVVRILDFWGVCPKAITDGDPNFTTVLFSNLGSIKGPAIYHHLNNYGTNSMMITVGTVHKAEVLMADGSRKLRDMLDIGITLDERIGDGFYFVKSLKLLKHISSHPELLDMPFSAPSNFDYG